jgi:hypothetical protein
MESAVTPSFRQAIMDAPRPTTWGDLTPAQFMAVCWALRQPDPTRRNALIATTLLGISWRTPRRALGLLYGLTDDERVHLCRKLAEPFTAPMRMVHTPLQVLHVRKGLRRVALHCCTHDLLNELDTWTWGMADSLFLRYEQLVGKRRPSLEPLHGLAAMLYAPAGMSRADRLRMAAMTYAERMDHVQLHAIYCQWHAHRLVYQRESPNCFSRGTQRQARNQGWEPVVRRMAGGKFGSLTETSLTPARSFLRELNDLIDQQRKPKHNPSTR